MLTPDSRRQLAQELPALARRYKKLLMNDHLAAALLEPPKDPDACIFSKMSVNYTADLEKQVEPCIFGGSPDCSQCGCAVSIGMHAIGNHALAGPFKVHHLMQGSVAIGRLAARLTSTSARLVRWGMSATQAPPKPLVQIR